MEALMSPLEEAAAVYAQVVTDPNRRNAPPYVVEDRGFKTPCFVWLGATNAHGYGRVIIRGKDRLVHQVSFERRHGSRAPVLDHLCRVHACFRPDHLENVEQVQNVRRGHSTKLSPEQVQAIRMSGLSSRKLGRLYGVTHHQVLHIKQGRRWSR